MAKTPDPLTGTALTLVPTLKRAQDPPRDPPQPEKPKAKEKEPLTAEAILLELEDARLVAMDLRLPSQAVAASMGKAKIAGLIIDRKEVGTPGEFAMLSDADLEAEIKETEKKLRKFKVAQ